MTDPSSVRLVLRASIAVTLAATVTFASSGCRPEPAPSGSEPATASATPLPTEVSPSPVETITPDAFDLPAACELVYSAQMLNLLETDVAPLNDPGVTMVSTQIVEGLEVLDGAEHSVRCTWGPPSERGMATTVTIVTAEQSAAIAEALRQAGFARVDDGAGSRFDASGQSIDLDDDIVESGESHYLRDDVWVATRWVNVFPEGYTDDIVSTLWG